MKITVVSHTREGFQVHKCECRDILAEQKKRRVNSTWDIEIPDGQDIAQAVSDSISEDFGWTPDSGEEEPSPASSIRLMPCVKK